MSNGLKKVGVLFIIIVENYCETQKEQTDSIFNTNEAATTTTDFRWPSDILIDNQQGISHHYTHNFCFDEFFII